MIPVDTRLLAAVLTFLCARIAQADGLTVEESGTAPDRRITVTSPGAYRAVLWQASQ